MIENAVFDCFIRKQLLAAAKLEENVGSDFAIGKVSDVKKLDLFIYRAKCD
jgi:hypothetical protein